MTKNKCWDCKYRGEVAGSAHSCCEHPATATVRGNPMAQLAGIMGRRSGMTTLPTDAARVLNIRGAEQGIRRGWFLWPMNFDPTWLENCDGFTAKESATKVDAVDPVDGVATE